MIALTGGGGGGVGLFCWCAAVLFLTSGLLVFRSVAAYGNCFKMLPLLLPPPVGLMLVEEKRGWQSQMSEIHQMV